MARPNVYRELNRKVYPVPAREIKLDWAKIEREEDFDPWEEELFEESTPWQKAFELGAEQANDEYFEEFYEEDL